MIGELIASGTLGTEKPTSKSDLELIKDYCKDCIDNYTEMPISKLFKEEFKTIEKDLDRLEHLDQVISECIELLNLDGQGTKDQVLQKLKEV